MLRSPIPIDPARVRAASELSARIPAWHRSEEALVLLGERVTGFSPAETLLKATAVNALYSTNVMAIVRVSEHFATELSKWDLATCGPELVVALAAVPQGGSEPAPKRRISLASKFAHFFIDENRFPIYDQYAVAMVAKHLGIAEMSLSGHYVAFAAAFGKLAATIDMHHDRRRLDRYLWVQGQYEAWLKKKSDGSSHLRGIFERGEWR